MKFVELGAAGARAGFVLESRKAVVCVEELSQALLNPGTAARSIPLM